MRFSPEKAAGRREFVRAGLRYSLLTLLAVSGGLLARRGQLTGQRCVNQGICSRCVAFDDCKLPAALSAKQAKAGG